MVGFPTCQPIAHFTLFSFVDNKRNLDVDVVVIKSITHGPHTNIKPGTGVSFLECDPHLGGGSLDWKYDGEIADRDRAQDETGCRHPGMPLEPGKKNLGLTTICHPPSS